MLSARSENLRVEESSLFFLTMKTKCLLLINKYLDFSYRHFKTLITFFLLFISLKFFVNEVSTLYTHLKVALDTEKCVASAVPSHKITLCDSKVLLPPLRN